ncbi:MAG TPA: hypothetical protein PLG34_13815, partial [Spirochaetota bacterium]|nr:hypothetical protein [Spirochaetota bacterium]
MDDQFKKWEDLQKKIIEEIQKIKNDPTKTRQLSKLKKELANLKKESSNWLANEIKKEFKLGASSVDEYINTLTGETPNPNKLNLEGVGDLITEARGNFTNATNFVNRSLNNLVKEAQKERDQLNVIQDVNRSTLETILKGKLADEGVTAIETSNGRKLQLDSYVKMATQSTLKIARNKGVINQCKSRDIDLVKMTVHFPTCSICLPLQGRVYSISGTSDTYPPLSKAFGEWETVHPNCKHSIMPYIPDYVDQDQLEEDIKNSNRSYTILNPKEQEALDRYNQEQKRKSLLRTAKKEYNNMSIVLGKDQMPSFPGFLKSKRSSGNV